MLIWLVACDFCSFWEDLLDCELQNMWIIYFVIILFSLNNYFVDIPRFEAGTQIIPPAFWLGKGLEYCTTNFLYQLEKLSSACFSFSIYLPRVFLKYECTGYSWPLHMW